MIALLNETLHSSSVVYSFSLTIASHISCHAYLNFSKKNLLTKQNLWALYETWWIPINEHKIGEKALKFIIIITSAAYCGCAEKYEKFYQIESIDGSAGRYTIEAATCCGWLLLMVYETSYFRDVQINSLALSHEGSHNS